MVSAPVPLPESDGAGWPPLPPALLKSSRGSQVCLTCHHFRHHPAADGIPVLVCHRHQGLIGQGDHLTRRCHGWTREFHLERGWAPEA